MILTPIMGSRLRPIASSWINQTRGIRPTIKIDKETFELSLDVRQFHRNELKVKARSEYVIIEGKQERKSNEGLVIRQFVRKFKLPVGCNPETMKTRLTSDGMLTITAPRKFCEKNLPCETVVPIIYAAPDNEMVDVSIQSKGPPPSTTGSSDPCKPFFK